MIFKTEIKDSKNSQNQTVTKNIFKDSRDSTDYFSLYILNLFFIYSL